MAACLSCWGAGDLSAVRVSRSLFLNHIHIHIHNHIHSANGLQNLHLHNTTMQNYAKSAFTFFCSCKLYTCTKSIYNNNLRRAFVPLILICSSFAPLAVVAFFPFFCRFSADFRPFSALLRVHVISRVFALFFVFMQNNFCIFCICKICICILRACKNCICIHFY